MRNLPLQSALFCLSLALPSIAEAACPGETLMHCQIGKKDLQLCLERSTVTYRFGPARQPELQIRTKIRNLDYAPWSGAGRAIWEGVTLYNEGVGYEVWTSFDRSQRHAALEGGINVLRGEKILAQLDCNPGSVSGALDRLFEAKEEAGQCFNRASYSWQAAPCD